MTVENLYRHHDGYFDDVDDVLETMKPLGNFKYVIIAKEYFANRRKIKAIAERHKISVSTVQNMIRVAVENLREIEEGMKR